MTINLDTINLNRDLAKVDPLHELKVFKRGGKTFVQLLFELHPDAVKALNPIEGEDLMTEHDARGLPIRKTLPETACIEAPSDVLRWRARSVPTLPAEEEKP